ncbi:HTH-type transcriptional repressor PurR [Paenibacillus plantiphilus]|uniref:HTH-type transcriptional repressor PurR n=1 Tax=Paenibacillus plantiphilus TaxID=2905650 RepID=A0ABM9CAN0_9BACL|nr:LacI family DNA-binding transcriptional regulator [Paenibacillus plantiphilus]CAH1208737.1 HTH-type transcriptional repressor PurR [Paenibacillus plantiphilus]
MMKKITMKDIAKETNLSVATVSYVLNNVKNQTIPEETRRMVQEAAQRLHYVPNLAARSLVKSKTGLIGLLISSGSKGDEWRPFSYASFLSRLEKLWSEQGYHLLVSTIDQEDPRLHIILERNLDGVYMAGVRTKAFYQIAEHFTVGVPAVIIDSLIDDDLFHKIVPNLPQAIAQAKDLSGGNLSFLITDNYNNDEFMQLISSSCGLEKQHIHVAESEAGVTRFLSEHTTGKGIIINEFIAAMAAKHIKAERLAVICTADCPHVVPVGASKVVFEGKAERAFEIMNMHLKAQYEHETEKMIWIPTQLVEE